MRNIAKPVATARTYADAVGDWVGFVQLREIALFVWTGGDTILWDANACEMWGMPVENPEPGRLYSVRYEDWAARVWDETELARSQTLVSEALATGAPYQSIIKGRGVSGRSFRVLSIGSVAETEDGKKEIRGISISLHGSVDADSPYDTIMTRLQSMTARTEGTFEEAKALRAERKKFW